MDILEKVCGVIKSNQKGWLKPYIKMNTFTIYTSAVISVHLGSR